MSVQPIEKQMAALTATLTAISEREIPAAQVWVLNRTMQAGVTQVSRDVSKAVRLPVKLVKKRMFQRKANFSERAARVRFYARDVSAIALPGVRDKGRYKKGRRGRAGSGVSARGGYKWRHGFIATGNNGKDLVFVRNAQDKLEKVGVPIESEVKRLLEPALRSQLEQEYPERMRKELQRRIDKYRAKS